MAKNGKNTAETVRQLIAPTVSAMCFDLWDVEFVKEGAEWILRITIDSPEGIGIEDCEAVSRAIDPILDEADPIESSYRMEVSSPGIERTLRTPEHFAACEGMKASVKLFAPDENGDKTLVGILGGFDDEKKEILITTEKGERRIAFENAAKANLVCDF